MSNQEPDDTTFDPSNNGGIPPKKMSSQRSKQSNNMAFDPSNNGGIPPKKTTAQGHKKPDNTTLTPSNKQEVSSKAPPKKMRAQHSNYLKHLVRKVQRHHNVQNLPVTSELQEDLILQRYKDMAEKRSPGKKQDPKMQVRESQNQKKKYMQKLIKEQRFERLINILPFGQTVRVDVMIQEGNKKRAQAYTGALIHTHKDLQRPTFTIQKWSRGICVERVFPLYCPDIVNMVVIDYTD